MSDVEIGLISDTHGQLRAQVHDALAGVEIILHAGDVGGADVLRELAIIAPVRAVRGNTDPPEARLPATLVHEADGVSIRVSHGHELGVPTGDALLTRYAEDVLVYGHTHVADITEGDGRMAINPGAAGPPRGDGPPSVARLTIRDGAVSARIVPLK